MGAESKGSRIRERLLSVLIGGAREGEPRRALGLFAAADVLGQGFVEGVRALSPARGARFVSTFCTR